MTLKLRDVQIAMRQAVQDRGPTPEFVCSSQRLAAYREGYPIRLFEALRENFEAVAKCLGPEAFWETCMAFIRGTSSRVYNLNDYHEDFPNFLSNRPESVPFPFIADLARYEWLFMRTFHAQHLPSITQDTLSRVPPNTWADISFGFQPHLNFINSSWPIVALWNACVYSDADYLQHVSTTETYLALFRNGDDVFRQTLTPPEYQALSFFKRGLTLGEACDKLAHMFGDVPIFEWTQRWLQQGWITSLLRSPEIQTKPVPI